LEKSDAFLLFLKKTGKSLHFAYLFCIFVVGKITEAGLNTWSCSGRCKILPRSPQEVATPAARYCHARRKPKEASSFSLFT
jgi:hypothetical protein